FHQAIYEYVYLDNTAEGIVKRGMLRQAALDPALMKKNYNPDQIRKQIDQLQKKGEKLIDDQAKSINKRRLEALQERLKKVSELIIPSEALKDIEDSYATFTQWITKQNPDEVFNEDFLIKMGHRQLVIWAFFNFRGGINYLINESQNTNLKKAWHSKEIFSSKYAKLKEILDQLLSSNKQKILIFSGFYMTHVTSGLENLEGSKHLGITSLFDYLRKWYGDDTIIRIDGSVSLNGKNGQASPRELARLTFRFNPRVKIILSTQRSSRLGIDLTVPSTKDNEAIDRVYQIHLDRPDTYADVVQTRGRSRRPGQKKPLTIISLHLVNGEYPRTKRYGLFDSGIEEDLEYKKLIGQQMLDGVPLTEAEERFMEEHTADIRINVYPMTPRTYLYRRFFQEVRGKGLQKNKEYMGRIGYEGMTNAEFFAAYYPQYDMTGVSGHNIRVIASIIDQFREQNSESQLEICDVGSGSGALQVTLGQPITNIDILSELLQVASERFLGRGKYLHNEASNLELPSDSTDITNASFMIHWTANKAISVVQGVGYTSERAQVLQELNRIAKPGGLVTITVPASYLTETQFLNWKETLEKNFGFKLHGQFPSGLVKAVDYKAEPISWMFNLVKVAKPNVNKNFLLHNLDFQFEQEVTIIERDKKRKKGKGESVSLDQPVPHSQFEVWQPDKKTYQKLTYEKLAGPDDIIAKLGLEEYGFYRYLIKEAKKRLGNRSNNIEELARRVLETWMRNGKEKNNPQKIRSELMDILEEILEGGERT
ncbi:methyltransferase domain-containing protein, partial [Candidatus Roizmanbacteria bacterium]|nr:methyltransferase domain-containing protein [Candidatus Roizmanbacteria bacterium]